MPHLKGEADWALGATAQLSFTCLALLFSLALTQEKAKNSLEINDHFQKCLQETLLFVGNHTERSICAQSPLEVVQGQRPCLPLCRGTKPETAHVGLFLSVLLLLLLRRGNNPAHKNSQTSGQVMRASEGP